MSLTIDDYVKRQLAIPRSTMRAWIWVVTHDAQSVEAYARVVCLNLAMDCLRPRKDRRDIVEYIDPCDGYADERHSPEVIRVHQKVGGVRTALERIPGRRRLALVLNRMYGFTAKEIATKMGINVPTVKRLLYDATVSLKEFLDRDDAAHELRLLQQTFGARE